MNVKAGLDMNIYAELVAKIAPIVISSEEDYQSLMAEFNRLFARSLNDNFSPEEEAILDLLFTLIHKYERDCLNKIKGDPISMLKFLMELHRKKPKDLWAVLGSKSLVSGILSGSRKINIDHAKKLAKYFNTTPIIILDLY